MARRAQIRVATALANASSTGVEYQGGQGVCFANGTFGGGSYALEIQGPDGAWYTVGAGTTFTAKGVAGFTAPNGILRMTGTGGAGNTVDAWVVGVPTNNGG